MKDSILLHTPPMRPVLVTRNSRPPASPIVVVVDDDPNIRMLLERLVVKMGCVAHTADNAERALDVLRDVSADVVLCDIRMPGYDGAWLIDRILDQWPGLPVVIVSGVAELDPRLTLRSGVSGYVLKPFDIAELRTSLIHAMGRPLPVVE